MESEKNHDGPHAWSSWMPYNSRSKYRHCLVQFCKAHEIKEVK